ncbi:MAG TPA: DUF2845 domain-containing protein [Solimonas sp.]|nr:DUF2845 domain-containing protein [Solimonas sp.]
MRQFIAGLIVAALSLGASTADAAGALRCGSRLVSEGDRTADLIAACGEPAYRDQRGFHRHGHYYPDSEEWYYNFGPSQLLRVIRLRNARIVSIDADGYGYNEGDARACESGHLVPGLSRFRLQRMCGEPLTRKSVDVYRRLEDRPSQQYPSGYGNAYEPVHREEWVYNFGSRYLMRILTIEDGRIVDVESGSRGFD